MHRDFLINNGSLDGNTVGGPKLQVIHKSLSFRIEQSNFFFVCNNEF